MATRPQQHKGRFVTFVIFYQISLHGLRGVSALATKYVLKQRVDKRRDRGDANDEHRNQQQEDNDRDDPPRLVRAGKGPELAEQTKKTLKTTHD